MRGFVGKPMALAAAALAIAALLGGSLGIVAAGARPPLQAGFNLTGGPLGADVQPDAYVGCLPANSWSAVYIFDGTSQTWKHFFAGVPGYVNQSGNGGIAIIPRFAGVVLIMNQPVPAPKLRDTAAEACG